MKYIVSVSSTKSYQYSVEASTEKEAKKLANKLHNDPKTQDTPITDWYYEAEVELGDLLKHHSII